MCKRRFLFCTISSDPVVQRDRPLLYLPSIPRFSMSLKRERCGNEMNQGPVQ